MFESCRPDQKNPMETAAWIVRSKPLFLSLTAPYQSFWPFPNVQALYSTEIPDGQLVRSASTARSTEEIFEVAATTRRP